MDDDTLIILILIALLLLVLSPIGFVLTLAARGRIARLESELRELERQLRALGRPPTTAEAVPDVPPLAPAEAHPEPPWQPEPEAPRHAPDDLVPAHGVSREAASHVTIEEKLGTRWTVWVGGAALALGSVLLVRYGIDQGLFGPAMQIGLGAVLAVLLVAAGEFLRRRDPNLPPVAAAAGPAQPYIPGVLTAAGTIAAFATIYAAHALYGFIGPVPAFVLLGATGLAAMLAAALHGPGLAGLGLIGALATPLLVVSKTPNAWSLTLYLAMVAAAAYALARLRNWLWLALSAAAGAGLWALALATEAASAGPSDRAAILAHGAIQLAFACFVFAFDRHAMTPDASAEPNSLAIVVPAAFGLIAILTLQALVPATSYDLAWIIAAGVDIALLAATGFLAAPAAGTLATGAGLFLACLAIWPKETGGGRDLFDFFMPGAAPVNPRTFAAFAGLGALALGALAGRRLFLGVTLRLPTAAIYAASAALVPLGALIFVYLRMTMGEASMSLAAIAAAVGVAFTMSAGVFRSALTAEERQPIVLGLGAFASAALAALALAFVFALSGGTLTVALALAALGAAFVAQRLAIPALRWCVAALGLIVAARLAYDPRVVGAALGTVPIFNWLLFGYGVPALAFGLASVMLRGGPHGTADIPPAVAEAMAILFSAFLVFFEIRHAINGGNPFAATSDLVEQGLFAVSSFGFTLVLTRLQALRSSVILRIAALCFGLLGLATAVFALLFAVNPLFAGGPLEGGALVNALLLGYAGPALLALLVARQAGATRPHWYVLAMRMAAIALVFAYTSLEIRRLFQGPAMSLRHPTSDAEWYTYSAVWLCLGILLLAYGLWRGARDLRIASAVFVVASILKVFLLDLAWLEGIIRAVSFIGLGLVLIGIGLVYQKMVFARPAPPTPGSA